MGILSSALQTLSQMAIQESGLEIPKETDQDICEQLKKSISNLPMLEAKECVMVPQMIPIKECRRLGYYLVEMEDVSRYMMTNGIRSFQEALTNIAAANDVPEKYQSRMAIVIDEDSILDEVAALGNNIDSDYWTTRPKAGLGLPMIGKGQAPDESKLRKIANTKQLLDVLTGRYGIPLVRKNYNQVGLLASANADEGTPVDESAGVNVAGKNAVLNEKDCKCGKADCPVCGKKKAVKEETDQQQDDQTPVQEETQMDPHAAYIQRIRDIASGKLDHELDNGF